MSWKLEVRSIDIQETEKKDIGVLFDLLCCKRGVLDEIFLLDQYLCPYVLATPPSIKTFVLAYKVLRRPLLSPRYAVELFARLCRHA